MSNYFDKDFFRFLFGFMTIILVGIIIILAVKIYSSEQNVKQTPVVNTANP